MAACQLVREELSAKERCMLDLSEHYQDKASKLGGKSDKIAKYMLACMRIADKKEVETPLGKVFRKETTATDIYDQEALIKWSTNRLSSPDAPNEFVYVKRTTYINKDVVKKTIEKGEEVPGARLVQNEHIRA